MLKTILFTKCVFSFWFNKYFLNTAFGQQKKFIMKNCYFSNFLKNIVWFFYFFCFFFAHSKFNHKNRKKNVNCLFSFLKKSRLFNKCWKNFPKISTFLNNLFVFFLFLWYNTPRFFKFFSIFKTKLCDDRRCIE